MASTASTVNTSTTTPVVTSSEPTTTKKGPDPLIYIIIFAILFLITLGLLTWVLDVYNKQHQCVLDPNIWCADTWNCQNSCDSSGGPGTCVATNSTTGETFGVSPCFCTEATGATGLASCLFGSNAPGATICVNPGTGGETGTGSCMCPEGIQTTQSNCFHNCYQSLSDLANSQDPNQPTTNCCCTPTAELQTSNPTLYAFCLNNPCNLSQ